MTILQQRLEQRLGRELGELRAALDGSAQLIRRHEAVDQTEGAPPISDLFWSAAWIDGEGVPRAAASPGQRAPFRPATCGEVLDALEEHGVAVMAQTEARALELCAAAFVAADDDRGHVLEHVVDRWPWTRTAGAGEEPASHYLALFWSLRDMADCAREQWPAGVEPRNVLDWVVEGFERRQAGAGERYASWCNGTAAVALVGDPALQAHSADVLGDRVGWPDDVGLWSDGIALVARGSFGTSAYSNEHDHARTRALDNNAVLVRSTQLASLYAALPSSLLQARGVRRLLGRVAAGDAQKHLIEKIAPRAIEDEGRPVGSADLADATGQLAEATRRQIAEFRGPNGTTPSTAVEADEFASKLDDAFAALVARCGRRGKDLAAKARERFRERPPDADRWSFWKQNELGQERFLVLLARALWTDTVERNLQRRAAVVRAVVADRLLPLMTRQTQLPELDNGMVCDSKGRPIGHISLTTDATLEAVRRGAHALGTVTGNRLMRSLIHRSHAAWNRGEQDPRRVSFEGGWAGLLSVLSISDKMHAMVREIAQAGQCIVWKTEHAKYGGLWTWTEERGKKTKPGEVAFVLGDALTPGYGDELSRQGGNGLSARIARRLVPELRFEPPMGGARNNDHGSIWTLHRLMLVELVDHAEELHTDGAVVITPGRWRELAHLAGVGSSIVDRTLDAWVAGESATAPALLERSGDGWTLAKSHIPERVFIANGGAQRALGRQKRSRAGRKRTPK